MIADFKPGPILLFGSGETSPSGRKIFAHLMQELPASPRVAVLETPAGFELNTAKVAGRIADFIRHHLQNFNPRPEVIPARKKGTQFSPDAPALVAPILESDLIFMGPGSPTYTVRQLQDSLAWHYVLARHGLGAALAFSSAAAIASGTFALPVYEIYKVGEDPHWKSGLDLFALYGLSLTIIPHWDNNDGGAELDTSRCFVGKARFEALLKTLPVDHTVIGIDEHTGLLIDCAQGRVEVLGKKSVAVLRDGDELIFGSGTAFPLTTFGVYQEPDLNRALPSPVWQKAVAVQNAARQALDSARQVPQEVQALIEKRESARAAGDWVVADDLRDQIGVLGWQVTDTPEGPVVSRQ